MVGLLFWPRGAASALRKALAEAYADSARYLERGRRLRHALLRGPRVRPLAPPADEATRAAAASRRLDDAFRSYLAERGSKPVPLAEVTTLVTGAAALRLTADAVLDLWQRDEHQAEGDRETAAQRAADARTPKWRAGTTSWPPASRPGTRRPRRSPTTTPPMPASSRRCATTSSTGTGNTNATAVRMIWTGDHLDAARRMQGALVEPARETTEQHPFWSRLTRGTTIP